MKADLNGYNIHFEVFGEGQPVICLHGWNEECSVFKTRAYKSLLQGYKIYAVDLPGFGESEGLDDYTFEVLNEILEQFAEYVGLNDFTLLGQCMGGIIALDFAIRHKEKVRKLILIETMIYFPLWLNLLLVKYLNSWVLKFMIKRKIGMKMLALHRALKNTGRDKRLMRMLKKADVAQSLKYIRLMKKYSRYDHIERSKDLNMPVTIITTGNTFYEVKKTASQLVNVLENVQRFTIPSKSHFIYIQ
ncbi:MAG: alpha/beta hydrolase [Clostridia bacterium]|nr:alpha/beta hydrolase [Clostridia bacterium]